MNSIARLNAAGKNKIGEAVVAYLMETEYYLNGRGEAVENTRWAGKLARDPELNLHGKPVEKADMLALAQGFSPNGKALCKNAGELPREVIKMGRDGKPKLDKEGNPITKIEGGHRVGFDITFSAPKPYSMAFAIAEGDERDKILDAHRQATSVAMRYLEEMVETRRGKGGKDVIEIEGLIYMQADHLSSRNLDMQLHTHSLAFGVAKGVDGKWGTYDALELYRHRVASDVIYKNELAANMRQLGYAIEQERQLNDEGNETGQILYKIAGISDELCEQFSSRRQEILEYQDIHGVSAQAACLATRRHKDEPSYAEMSAMWKATMESMPEGSVPTTEQLKQQTDVLMEKKSFEQILERLHQNEAVISEHNLVEVLGQESAGTLRYAELMDQIEAFKKSEGLVEILPERLADEDKGETLARRHTQTRYAAPWMVKWEEEIVRRVQSRKDETHQALPEDVVQSTMAAYEQRKGFKLSDEQREMINHATMTTGGVAVLEGFAGTGKTTVSDCYAEAFKSQGRNMLGACVSNAAAEKLEAESGMPCMSVSKMLHRLDKGKMHFTRKDVLVVDEAGMLDTNQTRQLLAHAQKGSAKVIFQGDVMQLQPIGAGSGMSLAKEAIGSSKLTEIRRQANEADRQTALAFYNRGADGKFTDLKKGTRSRSEQTSIGSKILAALDKRGALDDYDTQTQAIDAVMDDYKKSAVPIDERLVLGHTRAEVAALNEGIRGIMKEQGKLGLEDTEIATIQNGTKSKLAVAKGDLVMLTKASTDLGVINGSKGILRDVRENSEKGGHDLTIELQSEITKQSRMVKFNTKDFAYVAHNFATTVHKAQGAGKEQVFHLCNTGMLDNHSALVAFTRLTKGDYRLYGTTEDIVGLKERFGLERLKTTAMDAGLYQAKAPNEAVAIIHAQSVRADHQDRQAAQSTLTDADREQIARSAAMFRQRVDQRREQQQVMQRGREGQTL